MCAATIDRHVNVQVAPSASIINSEISTSTKNKNISSFGYLHFAWFDTMNYCLASNRRFIAAGNRRFFDDTKRPRNATNQKTSNLME